MNKELQIRNSTAEFLTFVAEGREDGVQVLFKDEMVWATQKAMGKLFDVGVPAISKHLKDIYDSQELQPEATISKMETVVNRGFRGDVREFVDFYNLDAIIAVGYRVNSKQATEYRKYKQRTISDVEHDYLEAIKDVGKERMKHYNPKWL